MPAGYPKPSLAWACVAILVVAYALSFVDRMILTLLVDPIRADLRLGDVQISLLQGFSFALFYTFAGIPIGRLVDSGRRTRIIAIGIALWSLMTAACGVARQYWQLFLARAGVGVGEASLAPAAYSLLSDLFPPERRGLAFGIFSSGSSIGSGLALVIGGWVVGEVTATGARELPWLGLLQPWQLTFVYIGVPGLLVALLVLLIPEPARRLEAVQGAAPAQAAVPLREVLAYYRRHARTIGLHHLAVGLAGMASYGVISWVPVMLMRVQGWGPQRVGLLVGGCILTAGTIGVIAGGWLGDHLIRKGHPTGRLMAAALSMVIGLAGGVSYPLLDAPVPITACLWVGMLGGFMVIGCSAAALMDVMPNRLRGQATAIYFFISNLIGLGAGPTVVALFTDFVFGTPGSVRYSLLIVPPVIYVLAALCFWVARGPYRLSLAAQS
ncbi:MAG: MFS transporter [Gammaproteobacteria bacterium]